MIKMIKAIADGKSGKLTLKYPAGSTEAAVIVRQLVIFTPKAGTGHPVNISVPLLPGDEYIIDISKSLVETLGPNHLAHIVIDLDLDPTPADQPEFGPYFVSILDGKVTEFRPQTEE